MNENGKKNPLLRDIGGYVLHYTHYKVEIKIILNCTYMLITDFHKEFRPIKNKINPSHTYTHLQIIQNT